MSHFTRVRTQITDVERLKVVLTDLRHAHRDQTVVRGYQGNSLQADVVVNPGGGFDIGFEKGADGAFQIVADWWGVQKDTGIAEADFVRGVVQRYAYQTVVEQVAKQGFQVVQETVGADQTLKVTVRRWA